MVRSFSRMSARRLLFLLVTLGGLAAVTTGAVHLGARRALRLDARRAQEQLLLCADALQGAIDRYRMLPSVLALDPALRAALSGTLDAPQRALLNQKLEEVNGVTHSSTLTLLDRDGVAVAASNWRSAGSNLGRNYAFRPYFRQALDTGEGRFYGVGVTTSEPGYFLSQAVRDDSGVLLGVVVIKVDLSPLEREWSRNRDVVLLSDRDDVVLLASHPAWRYRALSPLSSAARARLRESRKYAGTELTPLPWREVEALGGDGVLVSARPEASAPARTYLWRSMPLESGEWTLHLLRDGEPDPVAAGLAGLAAGGAWVATVFLALFVRGQRRLSRLRERSRRELEQLVEQHALALRTTQDGRLQLAWETATGREDSLEHLPQGVSVVDADLRLVAWNRRYVELFRFPPELMRVGRPIEDLFRYNARRGWLGPGDAEEAIQRRLDHLRAGTPHMHEREGADGLVLEIRGNPLPNGGFVTSYTDITSYRNAARELRSLATTLERRVEQRTHELRDATAEAQRANRARSRFVAAAVHDLLQPLNAARMFASALRESFRRPSLPGGRPQGEPALLDDIEEALTAQDAILNGLLDISHLESGTFEVKRRDVPLGPLFESLARELGVLAKARGLELCMVPSRVVVNTDEHLLRRVLRNFLSNALRYTPHGRVLLCCRREGADVRLEVRDSGPGIPEAQHAAIFEEFRRLEGAGARERGTGLGLAIVERISRLLGHRLALRSAPGRGSVFSVVVPRGDASRVAAPEPPPDEGQGSLLRGCHIWCLDDDPRVREATRTLLQSWECRVVVVGGEEEAARLASALDVPELLLLDYQLSPRTGPECLPALFERWGRAVPVIVVSAERDPKLRERVRASGWGFLAKPIRPAALRALVTQVITREGHPLHPVPVGNRVGGT
ncbi:PAS-domain containing protein [Myxococcus sp. K15C18031901]|uniref:hybrid sensor histidine kinase/response regulator n=1 Tax=Myxococcus dinghuensis TaxID=2906761 RepID=UPI0020A737D7|nr:hybrid sensor histidine kinase/response regulator [Myxococcus dinghuensis]MCP3098128.1 PAS-domain containing protein [Myxococcus dinghuensis]